MSELLSDYDYDLPPERIAGKPSAVRSASRLLRLDRSTGNIRHRRFADLPELLDSKDLLVFNDTRVIRARLHGRKNSGGKVEVLIERIPEARRALAQVRASKSPKAGGRLLLSSSAGEKAVAEAAGRRGATDVEKGGSTNPGEIEAEVLGRDGDLFELQFGEDVADVLESIGEVPLPPYIRRQATAIDAERYQTVYASRDGAVAAPTAGLHFDRELLERIAAKSVQSAFVTLHIGAGTFQPVREERIANHRMHSEYVEVPQTACAAVNACWERGGRVVAVGTTVVRALESAAGAGRLGEYRGETDIFIFPGFEFRVVDAMVTNFHLPRSSLLMLVSAFCGSRETLLGAYRQAIAGGYRFYSYGDAMFVS